MYGEEYVTRYRGQSVSKESYRTHSIRREPKGAASPHGGGAQGKGYTATYQGSAAPNQNGTLPLPRGAQCTKRQRGLIEEVTKVRAAGTPERRQSIRKVRMERRGGPNKEGGGQYWAATEGDRTSKLCVPVYKHHERGAGDRCVAVRCQALHAR